MSKPERYKIYFFSPQLIFYQYLSLKRRYDFKHKNYLALPIYRLYSQMSGLRIAIDKNLDEKKTTELWRRQNSIFI